MRSSRLVFAFFIQLCTSVNLMAHEGMWIPSVLGSIHDEMKSYGLKLSKEELYSVNTSSLKDAIVLFGGGCTGELVSPDGLLFTNHHCGFDYIQFHSSLQNDYLKNGFWAKNRNEELRCEGLTVTFVVKMEDVTNAMLEGVNSVLSWQEIERIKSENRKKIEEMANKNNGGLKSTVRAFNYGNQFFLIITKTYNDVRLVGAPPSEIGKFGGDTDNWVWPRHTGDFSVFRVYANKNNEPAEYNKENVPFHPQHYFPISLKGVQENDYSMVYGFPGRTEHLLTSFAVDYTLNKSNAMRIKMRETSLSVIDAAMKSSDVKRIQYAAKQSDISNAYKKWIGQGLGLVRYDAIKTKQEEERRFSSLVVSDTSLNKLLPSIEKLYAENERVNLGRDGFVEYFLYGPEVFAVANDLTLFLKNYQELEKNGKLKSTRESLISSMRIFYKNLDWETEKQLFRKMTPLYVSYVGNDFGGSIFSSYMTKDTEDAVKKIYGKTIFRDSTLLIKWLEKADPSSMKKWKKDPVVNIADKAFTMYNDLIVPSSRKFSSNLESLMNTYVRKKQELMPALYNWSDANSTLRVSFGKVEGSAPHDGMAYTWFTTSDGILDKYQTGQYDFKIGSRLESLLRKREFGPYAKNGELVVCYTASNHTTGGNSGSPALNADGHLVGINFDRSWESTMSDIFYSPEICRNIMVDAGYVLWVIDVYADAGYLLQEMKIVR